MPSSANATAKSTEDIVKTWFFNAPSHGIRPIGTAKTLAKRLFWAYIFWMFTILMCIFIHTVISNYITNPTKIHLSIRQYRDPAHFPAITFCNINPLQDDGFIDDVRKSKLPGADTSMPVSESEYQKAVSDYVNRILTAHVNGEVDPFVQWGFKLNSLLITCIFNERRCHRNLTQLYHPNYGNCYTFDNDHHVEVKELNNLRHHWLIDDNNGHNNYKLFLELFLHQIQYNEYLENRAAFRIFIHRKNELPVLSQYSLFLQPNRYTKLSFSQSIKSFSRLCRNELTRDMKKIFRTHKIRYTQALCYKLCEKRYLEQRCKCVERTLAVFYQFFNDKATNKTEPRKTSSICSMNEPCFNAHINFNASKSCQECLPECEFIEYSVQSSYARYPNVKAHGKVSKRVQQYFIREKRKNNSSTNGPPMNYKGIRDNIVAVEISASSDPTEILTESLMYSWVDLISSIGGQTSLWIGVSLISFVEMTELLYLLLNRCYSYIFPRQNN